MNAAWMLADSAEAGFLVERILASCGPRVVVTSCEDGAGKTLLCRILASVAADRLRRRVVYVDLNLRHPAPVDLFAGAAAGIERRGVGDDFHGLPGWARRERVQALLELPAGDALMVIDTSPLGVFNRNNVHPVNLAEWTRDFVLVVRAGSSRRSGLAEARALLARHGIQPRGAVFNARIGEGAADPASVTRWRDVVRFALRLRTEWPTLRTRLRSGVHAVRVVWRLLRPGIRRAFDGALARGPAARLLSLARRFLPGATSSTRQFLSKLRGGIDRALARKDGPWTRN